MLSVNSMSSIPTNLSSDGYKERLPITSLWKNQQSKSQFYIEDTKFERSRSKSDDVLDNPKEKVSSSDEALFNTMKYQINRLNSFIGKWPLNYIKPEVLAEYGFFYLQSEDRVQCAFCHVIIDDWNVGQKPQREHIKKSPRCPFLVSSNVGNIPIVQQKPVSRVSVAGNNPINACNYKPKVPRMSDLKKRLMTYRDFPLIMISSQQLAECGLYYTGVSDVVTCFFCGGSLGNWELNDDPWIEHTKFFPNCAYLGLVRKNGGLQRQQSAPVVPQFANLQQQSKPSPSSALLNDLIAEASNIFPKELVQKVVAQHLKDSTRHFSTLSELCEAVLEFSERENSVRARDVTGHMEAEQTKCEAVAEKCFDEPEEMAIAGSNFQEDESRPTKAKDILLCKICMDREMGIVFQPCGHLVACPKCAQLIYKCPVCRKDVTSKVRTYVG